MLFRACSNDYGKYNPALFVRIVIGAPLMLFEKVSFNRVMEILALLTAC